MIGLPAFPFRGHSRPGLQRRLTDPLARSILATAAVLCASAPAAGSVPIESWDLGRGLAGDYVTSLLLDDEVLWIGTLTGISRFDGSTFETQDERDGLTNAAVFGLLRTTNGQLWAATGHGLATLDLDQPNTEPWWHMVEAESGEQVESLFSLASGRHQEIWAGGESSLWRVEAAANGPARRMHRVSIEGLEGSVRGLVPNTDGGLWVGAGPRLIHLGQTSQIDVEWTIPPELAGTLGVTDLQPAPGANLWLATQRVLCWLRTETIGLVEPEVLALGVVPTADHSWCVVLRPDRPEALWSWRIGSAANGRIVLSAGGGMVEAGPSLGARPRPETEALLRFEPTVSFEDGRGRLWVGTGTSGLVRVGAPGIETYDLEHLSREKAAAPAVSSVATDRSRVFVTVGFFEPSRRVLEARERVLVDVTPPGAEMLAPTWGWGATNLVGSDGAWWVAHAGGVSRFPMRGERFGAPDLELDTLAPIRPYRLFEPSPGELWVAGLVDGGLVRFDMATGKLEAVAGIAELGRGAITSLARVGEEIWLGFYRGGLARLVDRRLELVDDGSAVRGFVYALHPDRQGRLWVGATGLRRLDDPKAVVPVITTPTPGSALELARVFAIATGHHGKLGLATGKGLFILNPDAAGAAEEAVLTSADGLGESSLRLIEATSDGAWWIAGTRSVQRFSPTERPTSLGTPQLRRLFIDGVQQPLPIRGVQRLAGVRIPPSARTIELVFAISHLVGGHSPPSWSWRIDGGEWSRPSTSPRLQLGALAPGSLEIEARAVTSGTTSAEVFVSLVVEPPWWRRAWFLALVVIGIALVAGAAHRIRVGRLVALERVRAEIAADLHDDLGSSLGRISILSAVASQQAGPDSAAGETLTSIGATARELAEQTSDIVWAIDPRRDDLGNLVARLRRFAEDLLESQGMRFEIEVSPTLLDTRLDPAQRRDLYLLLKEAVHNAAKYSGASMVLVSLTGAVGGWLVRIEDDGRGLESGDALLAEQRGGGHGFRTMKARAERLGGRLEVCPLTEAAGTRIELTVQPRTAGGRPRRFRRRA